MLGELKDKNFYCCGFSTDICGHFPVCPESCRMRHRKWPTPEQFKEEYREDWMGAVYYHCTDDECDTNDCTAKEWSTQDYGCLCDPMVVCVCTPFGRPDKDWRPETNE